LAQYPRLGIFVRNFSKPWKNTPEIFQALDASNISIRQTVKRV